MDVGLQHYSTDVKHDAGVARRSVDAMLAAVRQQQTVWRRHTKTHKPHRVGGSALGHQSTI